MVFLYTKGDGFKDVDNNTWEDIIDPRLQASYEEYEKNKRETQEFSSRIKKFATLKKNTFNLVSLIHKFNLKGPHYDESKFDDYTKWMRVYEKEISIAIDNKDAEAYVFFFEEFARLTINRAGMIDPNCKIKDCECEKLKI